MLLKIMKQILYKIKIIEKKLKLNLKKFLKLGMTLSTLDVISFDLYNLKNKMKLTFKLIYKKRVTSHI